MIRINLLPRNLRKRIEPGWWRLLAAGVPILALIVGGAMQLSAQNELSQVQRELTEAEAQIVVLEPARVERDKLIAEQNQLNVIIGTARSLQQSGGTPWSADLERFVSRIPDLSNASTVTLSALNMRPPQGSSPAYAGKSVVREFVLTGKARSSAALSTFVRAFEESSDTAIAFQNATKAVSTGADGQSAPSSDWTFSATIGLTPAATPVPASTTPESAPNPSTPTTPAPGGN